MKSMLLGDAAALVGRRNNFNLVRLLAALAVLVSHSFALSTGSSSREPFTPSLGMSLGSLAVAVFFITSGYLVGGSLLSHREPIRFVVSRVLRIYPALLVVVALTGLLLGPLLTTLPVAKYFGNSHTWGYLAWNGSAVFAFRDQLPGLFERNPYAGAVNGSLWSLRYELWMYGILLATWLLTAGRRGNRAFGLAIAALVTVGATTYWCFPGMVPGTSQIAIRTAWLASLFFSGVGAYLLRGKIKLSWPAGLIVASSLLGIGCVSPVFFKAIYVFCLTYLVLFIVYATPVVERLHHHDYSYGIYIYGFAMQQAIAQLLPGISPIEMVTLSSAMAICTGALSWRLIERPALEYVDRVTVQIRRWSKRRAVRAAGQELD